MSSVSLWFADNATIVDEQAPIGFLLYLLRIFLKSRSSYSTYLTKWLLGSLTFQFFSNLLHTTDSHGVPVESLHFICEFNCFPLLAFCRHCTKRSLTEFLQSPTICVAPPPPYRGKIEWGSLTLTLTLFFLCLVEGAATRRLAKPHVNFR